MRESCVELGYRLYGCQIGSCVTKIGRRRDSSYVTKKKLYRQTFYVGDRTKQAVSPSYSRTVARECIYMHIKCTVGRMMANPNDLYSVDELKDVCREAERWAIYRVVWLTK